MEPMEIMTIGRKVLREETEKVREFSEDIPEFIENMKVTMVERSGVGLAAPQVGDRRKIITLHYDFEKKGRIIEMINPEIISFCDEKEREEEGCLSIPGITGIVERPCEIEVRYQDITGKEHVQEFSGLNARIIQHEVDHLNKTLFVDRLSYARKLMIRKKLKKLEEEARRG
ncbi:MAG: peptide deformylase [Candidatus Krumholzibacteriales bacterium]